MNGFHIKGMAEDKRDVERRTEISNPVPGENAFNRYDDVFGIGSDRGKKVLAGTLHVLVKLYLSGLIQDADIHIFAVQVDSAVKFVLLGVESHKASS
jgi:hypothetical protein